MRLLKAMHENERFSLTELNIVRYILAHPTEIADMTTRELAEKTFSSPAAVFRLCQKLGLKGYNEFKIKFISEVNRIAPESHVIMRHPVSHNDRPEDIVRKMAELEIEAIEETKNELDIHQLVRVVTLMEKAKSIDFYAYDQNNDLAQMAVYNLLQIQKPATCFIAMNSQFAQALNSDSTHVAIIISRTGENRRLIRTAEILRDKKVPIVLLSDSPDTTLAHIAQEFLYIANTVAYLDMGGMIFSVGVRYLTDLLFGLLLSKDYNANEKFYNQFEYYSGKGINDRRRMW